jgi:predicted DNA-binding antitoxin AbrB/MazE fold protein
MSLAEEEYNTSLDIDGYTAEELRQLRKMTEEVRDHWKKMLAEAPANLSEGLRMAIELSIRQAEEDLKTIASKIKSMDTI